MGVGQQVERVAPLNEVGDDDSAYHPCRGRLRRGLAPWRRWHSGRRWQGHPDKTPLLHYFLR
eukprot:6135655-Pyramimonas_sp.AAC.1